MHLHCQRRFACEMPMGPVFLVVTELECRAEIGQALLHDIH
jgi:hypothetical protein